MLHYASNALSGSIGKENNILRVGIGSTRSVVPLDVERLVSDEVVEMLENKVSLNSSLDYDIALILWSVTLLGRSYLFLD